VKATRASWTLLLGLGLALAVPATACAAEAPIKIGFINVYRIESESSQAKQAVDDLKKEFAPRERQLQEAERQLKELREQIDREAKTMREIDRVAKEKEFVTRAQRFEQMKVAYAEEFQARRREILGRVIGEANAVIRQIAEAGNFDLILQEVVYFSPQIDLTDAVLKAMAKQAGGGTK